MAITLIIGLIILFLSFGNGGNDNFKGVATLYASGEASYKTALFWASLTTLAGVVCSAFFAEALIKSFSGKGLVPDAVVQSELFIASVSFAAGLTVILATHFGMPVSTTHGLVGALVGAGLMADFGEVNFGKLGATFLLPLLLSPLISILLGYLSAMLGNKRIKEKNPTLKYMHYLTSGAVCFARGLNDGPKIAGMLLLMQVVDMRIGLIIIGIMMVIGGVMQSRKVAATMSQKLAHLDHSEGMISSAVTATLVGIANFTSIPVSTTHVSVGSIFGVSFFHKKHDAKVFREIVLAWILTLPISLLLSIFSYFCFSYFIIIN